MPLEQQLLFKLPTFILGLIIIGGTIALSIAGLLIVRHFVPQGRLKAHYDVAAPFLGILGGMYAMLLVFMVKDTVNAGEGSENERSDYEVLAAEPDRGVLTA